MSMTKVDLTKEKAKGFNIIDLAKNEIVILTLLLIGLCVISTIIEPNFFSLSNFTNVSRQISILIMISVAQAFVIILGGIDVSVGATIASVSVVTTLTAKDHGLFAGILVGLIFSAIVGLIKGVVVTKFRIHSFIVTLGMVTILHGLALILTNGQPVIGLPQEFKFLGHANIGVVPFCFIIGLVVFLVGWFIWYHTLYGRNLRAIGGNETAAYLSGVKVIKSVILSYVISGVLIGLAAITLSSRVFSGQPNLGLGLELESIASVVIGGIALTGGRGNLGGALCGAFVIGLLKNALNIVNISSYVQMLIIGIVIIVAAIISTMREKANS